MGARLAAAAEVVGKGKAGGRRIAFRVGSSRLKQIVALAAMGS